MKVLIVCSGNAPDFDFKIHQAFIYEQAEALKKYFKVDYDTFFIKGKGVLGYLKNLIPLRKKIKSYNPDLIHAHFGLSGILANLQRIKPVILTLHGSDLNIKKNKKFSNIACSLSRTSIIVSKNMLSSSKKSNYLIPCGINFEESYPMDKNICREKLNLDKNKIYILFSSRFDNEVKNYSLAREAVKNLNNECELLELKNRKREEVNILLNAVDLLLLTSFSEGSPQIIKEAMACNCPIVATDVGDIKEIIGDTEGCYLTTFDPDDVAEKIELAIKFSRTKGRTNGREKIKSYDNKLIAKKIYEIYQTVIDENM